MMSDYSVREIIPSDNVNEDHCSLCGGASNNQLNCNTDNLDELLELLEQEIVASHIGMGHAICEAGSCLVTSGNSGNGMTVDYCNNLKDAFEKAVQVGGSVHVLSKCSQLREGDCLVPVHHSDDSVFVCASCVQKKEHKPENKENKKQTPSNLRCFLWSLGFCILKILLVMLVIFFVWLGTGHI